MSTRRSRAPIWTQPAPGARRPRLTREQIAQVALAIADAEGFDAVSMRRLATDLDVGTMTLYHYVRTKDDLIALMDDALMAEVLVPASEMRAGWRAGLTAISRASRDAFLRHPWALRSLEGARFGPNGMRHMEQSMAAVADLPLPMQERLEVLAMVDDFVFGHVHRVSTAWAPGSLDARTMRAISDFMSAQLETGEYPHLAGLIGSDGDPGEAMLRVARWMGEDQRFERGLAAMLDGIEARLKPRASGRGGSRRGR